MDMAQRGELKLVLICQLLFLLLTCVHNVTATIILTSTVDGRQAACPGEVVTYTCTVTQANALQWVALPFIMSDNTNIPRFLFSAAENTVLDCNDSPSAVECSVLDYQAILTEVDNVGGGLADMTSTFRFTANSRVNGTVVECVAVLNTGMMMSNSTLKVAGPPSPPHTPSFTIQQYGRDNVMLTVQWQSPLDDGGAPVDNYTITVSPGLITLTTTTTNAMVTIPYNVMHTVSIVATNCNGSSSAVMETNQAIVGCGSPSRPENGSVQSLNISQGTQQGSQIFFSCNTSYVPAGNMMSVCGSDGMWNPDPATFVCTFDCGRPESPRNGSVGSHPVTTEGSVVLYQCDQNLVPQQLMRSVCTVSGWSPNPAEQVCNVVNCGIPNRPMNGSVEPPQSTLGGSVVEFGCDPGFIPADRMMTTCTLNGTWSPDPGILACNVSTINCGNPPATAGGVTVRPSSTTTVSSVIYYQCQQSGFVPSNESSVCGEDGLWIPDPSQITCEMGPVTTDSPTATASTDSPTATASTELPTDPAVAQTGLSPGAIAGIIIVLLLIAVLVGAVVIVVFIWWRKRSDHVPPKPEPQSDDVAMYSVVDDSPVKSAPYKGYMLKGPEAEYSTVDDAAVPTTSKAVEAQYDLPPGSNHPEGLVYAEVNVKPKSSAKPRVPKPDKTDDMVEYAAIAYQPKDAAEKRPPVVEPTSRRMALPDNPDDSVNLDNLLIQLKQVNSMWRELGDALGLPPSILDDISGQYQSDPQQCMVEMLDSWLMRHMHQGSPTWWEVAQALRQIARSDLADALETVYTTGVLPITVNMDEIPEGSLPADTGSPPPIPVRGPLTDEPDYPPPKPPRGTPEKKAAPPRPPRGGSERKPKPEPGVPPRPPRAH